MHRAVLPQEVLQLGSPACDKQVGREMAFGVLVERARRLFWGWFCALEACGHRHLPKPRKGRAQGPCGSYCVCLI